MDRIDEKTLRQHQIQTIVLSLTLASAVVLGFFQYCLNSRLVELEASNVTPVLTLSYAQNPYAVTNIGKGVAFNIIAMSGTPTIGLTPENVDGEGNVGIIPRDDVVIAIGPGQTATLPQSHLQKISLAQLKTRLPIAYEYAKNMLLKNTNWVTFIYDDTYGNTYVSTALGSSLSSFLSFSPTYSPAMEYKKL